MVVSSAIGLILVFRISKYIINFRNDIAGAASPCQFDLGISTVDAGAIHLGGPSSLGAVAAGTQLSSSLAYQHLRALVDGGFPTQDRSSGRYDLGMRILHLGQNDLNDRGETAEILLAATRVISVQIGLGSIPALTRPN